MGTNFGMLHYDTYTKYLYKHTYLSLRRGGVEGPAGTANAVPLFTVVRIAVPLFKAGRTGAANVPPECAIVARVRIVHTHGPVP